MYACMHHSKRTKHAHNHNDALNVLSAKAHLIEHGYALNSCIIVLLPSQSFALDVLLNSIPLKKVKRSSRNYSAYYYIQTYTYTYTYTYIMKQMLAKFCICICTFRS